MNSQNTVTVAKPSARWLALAALALAMLTVGLDATVLNVALPTVAVDLGASTAQLQWFANAYTLVMAALLLPAGMLGDRYGRKKLLVGALVVFLGASLACAWSDSAAALIASRAVLGLGAAVMVPLSMAVLPVLFPPAERAKALTIWITATALGLPLGPIVGGWLLDHFWWGSAFLINVPLVLIAVIAVAVLVPESRSERRRPVDVGGVALSSIGLLGLTYGFIEAGARGWGDRLVLVTVGGGVALLVGFLFWQRRREHPLIDLALFRSTGFAWGTVLSTLVNFTMFGVLFAVPQFFQAVQGMDSLSTGLRLLPMIGGLVVGAKAGERVAARFGAKVVLTCGFVLLAGALTVGAGTTGSTGFGVIAGWLAALGIAMGLVMPTAMNAAIGALDTERAGVGSALIQAMRQVGGTIGVAVLGAVLADGYRSRLDLGTTPPQLTDAVLDSVNSGVAVARGLDSGALLDSVRAAYTHGMGLMLWCCAGVAALGAVVAVFGPSGPGEPRAEEQAESTDEFAVT